MKFYSEDFINKLLADVAGLNDLKHKLDETPETDCLAVDSFSPAEDECIVLMFPDPEISSCDIEGIQKVMQYLQQHYPDNPTIGILSDIDILVQNADEAIEMLDGMKAKIQILKDTPANKQIII